MAGTIKATKAELTDQLQAALGELQAARDLLAAIAAAADVPTPDTGESQLSYQYTMLNRLSAIKVHVGLLGTKYDHCSREYQRSARWLWEVADQPLSYRPYPEEPELAEAAASV